MTALPFPKHGVKLSYIAEFIDDACGGRDQLRGLNTTEVCAQFVMPKTAATQSSYCELLLAAQHPAVCTATVFISHAWKYKFLDVVDALFNHFGEQVDTVIWFDLFANNQHKATVLEFDWWCSTFKSAIEQIGHTVMIFAPWNDPIPLTRGWCIWELYCTLDTKSRFEIALSPAGRTQFLQDVIEAPYAVIDRMLATIDARKSECWKREDQDRIYQVISDTVGFSEINAMVFTLMRDWVVTATKSEIAASTSEEEIYELTAVLAALYAGQSKLREAEALYKECFSKCLEAVGSSHPASLDCMISLANIYQEQGKYSEAESLYLQCLEQQKDALSPELLCTLNGLATLYRCQGKFDKAESLYLQCLKQEMAAQHSNTMSTMINLATLYMEQNKYNEAESLYLQCIEQEKTILGIAHPETLITMNNLAMLYTAQGRYDEAEPMHLEGFARQTESLGATHPDTLCSMNNLADLYQAQGKSDEAERLLVECLSIRKDNLGLMHPHTLYSMNSLGIVYQSQGRYKEAELLHQECLEKRRESLGVAHPDTLKSMSKLAIAYQSQGMLKEAESLLQECSEKRGGSLE